MILLTTNTLLTLAHCQEFLIQVAASIKLFKRKVTFILQRLDLLIEKIIDYTDNDFIEGIFLDRDFKDRTLLKIVTTYHLKAFLKSAKSTILLDSIWQGAYSIE